jgi:hypothetical protein
MDTGGHPGQDVTIAELGECLAPLILCPRRCPKMVTSSAARCPKGSPPAPRINFQILADFLSITSFFIYFFLVISLLTGSIRAYMAPLQEPYNAREYLYCIQGRYSCLTDSVFAVIVGNCGELMLIYCFNSVLRGEVGKTACFVVHARLQFVLCVITVRIMRDDNSYCVPLRFCMCTVCPRFLYGGGDR